MAALPPPDATAFEAPAAAPWPDLRGRTATIAIVTALALLLLIAAVSVQSAGTDPWCDDGRRGLFDAEDEFADRNAVDRNSAEDPGRC